MGLGIGFSKCACLAMKDVNPNPKNFEIVRTDVEGGFVIAEVRYIGCTNYEGRKILMFRNNSLQSILDADSLDPHFCNNDECISPFARFEPSPEGWDMAIVLAKTFDTV
jgi:hypothetical protein